MPLAPVLALTHGGGPMPLLGDPSQKTIADSLRTKAPKVLHLNSNSNASADDNEGAGTGDRANAPPRAIIVVTAHWETDVVTVSGADKHDLYYDYYGFPPEAYKIEFKSQGSKEVATEVVEALKEAGLGVRVDKKRG